MNATKTIAARNLGTRRIYGTDWPVSNVAQRQQYGGGKVEWVVLVGLCNGSCDYALDFPTRRQALAELAARGGEIE